jgi:hypothetical protein
VRRRPIDEISQEVLIERLRLALVAASTRGEAGTAVTEWCERRIELLDRHHWPIGSIVLVDPGEGASEGRERLRVGAWGQEWDVIWDHSAGVLR